MRYAYVNRYWAQSDNRNQNSGVPNTRRTTFNSLAVRLTSRLNTQEQLPAIILSNDEAAAIVPSKGVPFLPDLRKKEHAINTALKEAMLAANFNRVHYLYAHLDALKAAVSRSERAHV